MKFSRSGLVGALEAVKGAIAQKAFVPILQHVLVEGNTLLGYDSEIGIKVKLDAAVTTPFNVKFSTFLDLLRQLEAEEVEITTTADAIAIHCGRHKSRLSQITEPYPKPDVKNLNGLWVDIPAGFKEALERCTVAVSEDENNRTLSALYIAGKHVYGADGRQVVRCAVEGMNLKPLMLPRKAANEVIRLGNPKRVAVKDSVAVFDYVNLTFLARLRDGETYPQAQLDGLFAGRTVQGPLPDGFAASLARLALLCGEDLKAVQIKCAPLGLEFSVNADRASGMELLPPEGVSFETKAINARMAIALSQFAASWDPGLPAGQLFYFTGETSGYEALMAPVLL